MPPVAIPDPTATPSLKIVTVSPASAVPVNVGVMIFVMSSVLDTPLSDAAVRSGADGVVGVTVSIVTDKPAEAAPTLPATSVALAVMLWTPSLRMEVAML